MTGRNGHDPIMVLQPSSSIALLQERFRRLQRDKEMRRERELLRGVTGNDNILRSPVHYDPPSKPLLPPPPPVALSLWPNVPLHHHSTERELLFTTNLWPPAGDATDIVRDHGYVPSNHQLHEYIDTSLHL